jgi:hypothetical protein
MDCPERGLRVFKAFDLKARRYLDPDELKQVCSSLQLPYHRIMFRGKLPSTIAELIQQTTPPHVPSKFKSVEDFRNYWSKKFDNVPVTTRSLIEYTDIFDYAEGLPAEGIVGYRVTTPNEPRRSWRMVSRRFKLHHKL